MDSLSSFAMTVLAQIEQELTADIASGCSALTTCGQENITTLLSAVRRQSQDHTKDLSTLRALSHEAMKQARHEPSSSFAWRRLYTDAALVWSLLDILSGDKSHGSRSTTYLESVVERLDDAIIIAGAPGEGKLDLVLDTVEQVQKAHLPLQPCALDSVIPTAPQRRCTTDYELIPSAGFHVPVLSTPPSLSTFRSNFSSAPFIIRRFSDDSPAIKDRKWASKVYLQSVSGRGRVVPVEIGRDYRTDDWSQCMMGWDEFLDYLFSDIDAGKDPRDCRQVQRNVVYLAQHDLFKQFPALREDLIIPDYVYASLPPPEEYPQYRPPANDEELVMNTWIGPKDTLSPAHMDPFYNCYTQVVGQKSVWLAPPSVSHILSPCPEKLETKTQSLSSPSMSRSDTHKDDNASNSILANTTQFEVFASVSDLKQETEFMETVVPVAMSAILDEGDMLFFPPGWWHAFRSESTSFSVSMWF